MFLLLKDASAFTNLEIKDDAYEALQMLEAEGVVLSGLLTTRPITRGEALRLLYEAEENSREREPYIRDIVDTLLNRLRHDMEDVDYIKPLSRANIDYVYADKDNDVLNYNNDGVVYREGNNAVAGFSLRGRLGSMSFHLNPELRYSERAADLNMRDAYGVFALGRWGIEAGRDSQWWGPGYHGSILLSTNAEPFTMVRLSNSEPLMLPWVFRYLGPFRFVLFVTRLEEDRYMPEPYFWGMRFNFKPVPYVELGIGRTALLCGKGRPCGMDTWVKSLAARGENEWDENPGDQRAGGDIKITLPLRTQPVQIYFEADGDDMARGRLPSKLAFLGGFYLPRIYSIRDLSFRAEYTTNHVENSPNVWYTHGIYGADAYMYNGKTIGHHMGTDSEDLFLEAYYRLPHLKGGIRLSFDIERHNLSGGVKPIKKEVSAGFKYFAYKSLSVEGKYAFSLMEDAPGGIENASLFSLSMNRAF